MKMTYEDDFITAFDNNSDEQLNALLNPKNMTITYYSLLYHWLSIQRLDIFMWNAQWHLKRKTPFELYNERDVFELCCAFGHKDLADWFYKNYTIYISGYVPVNARTLGFIELAEWLEKLT